jgi:hypothetical protein
MLYSGELLNFCASRRVRTRVPLYGHCRFSHSKSTSYSFEMFVTPVKVCAGTNRRRNNEYLR